MIAAMVLVCVGMLHVVRARHRLHSPGFVRFNASQSHAAAMEGIDALPADVYPSKRDATSAVAQRLAAAIASVDPDPHRIYFFLKAGEDANAFASRVRQVFPKASWKIDVENRDGEAEPGTVSVRVFEQEEPRSQARPESYGEPRGIIELRVEGQHGSTTAQTRYDTRTWISDFGAFANAHPRQTWIVARSRHACITPAEARAGAESDAAGMLADLVRQQILPSERLTIGSWRSEPPVVRSISVHDFVADRFLQHFHRPYGELWSEAILLDVSEQRLSPLVNERRAALGRHDARASRTVIGVTVVLAAILLAYLLLNTITKSYFSGRLRAGAVVAVAVLLLVAGAATM
jgi:hypothetical protein